MTTSLIYIRFYIFILLSNMRRTHINSLTVRMYTMNEFLVDLKNAEQIEVSMLKNVSKQKKIKI